MKLKTLLVLGASMFTCIAANAWEKPVPATQDFVQDGETEQYIYNVEAGKFLLGANDWNTRGSVGEKGYKWKIASTGEGTVSLTDYVETQSEWKKMFADGNAGIWVDNNAGANCDSWTLVSLGDNKYNIGNVAFPDELLGVSQDGADTRVYLTSWFQAQDPVVEAYYTWTSVSVEAYNAYFSAQEIYAAAMDLKAALDEAKARFPQLDLAAEQAVYDNESSTKEELAEAAASVRAKFKKAIADEAMANASLANPIDMTSMITNSTFDKIGDFTGWSGTAFGAGGTTSTCAEHFQKTFDTWQQLTGMPAGVYKVNVDGFYRAGGAPEDFAAEKAGTTWNPQVYGANVVDGANADVASSYIMHLSHGIEPGEHLDVEGNSIGGMTVEFEGETYYVPNSMKDFTNYNGTTAEVENPYYKTNSVLFPVSGDTLKIGVKNESTLGWTIVDNFGLTYYGNGADAWGALIEDYTKNCALAADVMVSVPVKEAYDAVVAGATATDYASYKAASSAIAEAKVLVDENVAKWAEYVVLAAQAKKLIEDPKYAEIAVELADYLEYDYTANIMDLVLTTDELVAEIAKLNNLYEEAKALTPAGTDVTGMLTNPDFAQGWTGWSHSGTGGNVAANSGAKCAEAWNSANFDIHQDIENAPVGVYEIQVQGFYRYKRGDAAWLEYFNEDGTKKDEPVDYIKNTPARIYANANTAAMANVFDYQVANGDLYTTTGSLAPYVDPNGEYWYPNDMTAAGQAFDQGAYTVSTFGLVAKKGDPLRVGIKGNSNQAGDSWAIFTRFKMVYQGFSTEIIKPELETTKAAIEAMIQDATIGSDVRAAAEAAIADAEAALAQEDGKVMFDALSALLDLKDSVENSVALFAELGEKIEALDDALSESEAMEATLEEASIYVEEIREQYVSGELTDEAATEAINKINSLIKKLAIPGTIEEASLDNPVDLTAFIVNPSFEDGVNGWTNLSGEGTQAFAAQNNSSFGKTGEHYAERWHAAGKLDMNQEITDLPCGTYMITVDAHASCGGVLYANDKETQITNIDAPASPSTDAVYVYIEEGQSIKIGVKGTLTGDTWFCVDNFQLFCVGYNKDVTGEATAVENVVAPSNTIVGIYNINGVQSSKLQKGINIVRLANGKVRKVLVK